MSTLTETAQHAAAVEEGQRIAEGLRRSELDTLGLADEFDSWRESLPDTRMDDEEVFQTFINSRAVEEGARSGRVSVSTGGEEDVLGADIPTPGPDGDGDSPDGDGEDAEGGDDDPTDLKLIEGMWAPPEESTAVNYDPPSTYAMTLTQDWVDEAKKFYDYSDRPEIEDGDEPVENPTDEQIANWARNNLSMFNWNVAITMVEATKIMTSGDSKRALNYLNLINMYDHSDGGAREFAMALLGIATDPTTYAGLGIGKIVATGAARATAKAGLRKAIQVGIIGGSAGLVEGGALAGGFDLTVQNIEQEAGTREDIDKSRVALATGAGMGLGLILGGGGGHLVGRHLDKLADASKLDAKRVRGLASEEQRRIADELSPTELLQMLEASSKASAEAGKRDEAAAIAIKYLSKDEPLPRNADGTLNEEQIARDLESLHLDEAARVREKGRVDVPRRKGSVAQTLDHIDRLERNTNWKLAASEDPYQILIEVTDKTPAADSERIIRIAKESGVEVSTQAIPNAPYPSPNLVKWLNGKMKHGWGVYRHDKLVDIVPTEKEAHRLLKTGGPDEMDYASEMPFLDDLPVEQRSEWLDDARRAGMYDPPASGVTSYITIDGSPEQIGKFVDAIIADLNPAKLPVAESKEFARRIALMDASEQLEIVPKTTNMPGSVVRTVDGKNWEVMGHTKNGWYHLRNRLTGEEINKRRKSFEVVDAHPSPEYGGPMELAPFTKNAAKIIAMNEQVVSGKLKEVKITHSEQRAIIDSLEELGIDITEKELYSYWTPAELAYLRDTYNAQANAMADYVRRLRSYMENEGKLSDAELANFNEIHTQFVATRDLFFGTVGNAARQLNILKMRPKKTIYEFSQAVMDSVNLQGGRANTERAISLMAEFASPRYSGKGNKTQTLTHLSENIWGNKKAAWLLNFRYNMMLSSWRTHFFNFTGNSASGVYQHLIVSPVKMGINNVYHALKLARQVIDPNFKIDPAERLTMQTWYAELRGHQEGFRDSLALAKEIAMGRSIGEGKVWNELGLRYNVINVPDSLFGKLGTTPVRALEAGDAFFKNQYYMSKLHELSSIKARADEIHGGLDYQKQYRSYVDNPDVTMQRQAKEFAAKQTYTNDPNIYGGVLAALAKGVSAAQNKSLIVNMIVPFVRTPANLLSYSMEMIGANVILSPSKTYDSIMRGTAAESQEALARLTVAAGMWLAVYEMYENGNITGTGPSNWEERKVWEAAGWQPNSIKGPFTNNKWVAIDRLDPAGQSLATIASVYDFYSMVRQQDKTGVEWIGAGLLYTADMIMDDSYLSTASDLITAIQSKEEARARSVTASMINSIVVPNLLRDLRRPIDAIPRSSTSTNLLTQVQKQMMNASPWHSKNLPPQRDWRGDAKNTYGNAYFRGMVPFNVRDPEDSDLSSMALAYARIPVSTPNKTIEWPSGRGDAIDLFAMDEGDGWLYDKYVQTVGNMRAKAVDILTGTSLWEELVSREDIGPNSNGDTALRQALGVGSRLGRLQMIGFLIQHSGDNNTYKLGNGQTVVIKHQVSVQEYAALRKAIKMEGRDLPPELKQYIIDKPIKGPEFFKP